MAREVRKAFDYIIALYLDNKAPNMANFDRSIRAVIKPIRPRRPCGVGLRYFGIDVEGTVWPCSRFIGGKNEGSSLAIGDVFGKWDRAAHDIFKNLDSWRESPEQCENCLAISLCGSPCPAVNYAVNGDMRAPSEAYCRLAEIMFREGQRAHYLLRKRPSEAFKRKFLPTEKRARPVSRSHLGPRAALKCHGCGFGGLSAPLSSGAPTGQRHQH